MVINLVTEMSLLGKNRLDSCNSSMAAGSSEQPHGGQLDAALARGRRCPSDRPARRAMLLGYGNGFMRGDPLLCFFPGIGRQTRHEQAS